MHSKWLVEVPLFVSDVEASLKNTVACAKVHDQVVRKESDVDKVEKADTELAAS